MSEATSALNGLSHNGIVKVAEAGLQGMITLRGDLSNAQIKAAATGVSGVDMPDMRRIVTAGDRGIAWMSPDELLMMVPYAEVRQAVTTMRESLLGTHHMVENVSDARAMFTLTGDAARLREVLAKLAPVDLAQGRFEPGEMRRTRLAQVPAAIWMPQDGMAGVVCFRSVARYVFDLLCTASATGSAVGYFDG